MATFQGTDLGDVLQIGAFPLVAITKDGLPLIPLITIQESDLAGNDTILFSDNLAGAGGKNTLKGDLGDNFYTVTTTGNGTEIQDAGGAADSLFILINFWDLLPISAPEV